MFLNSSRPPRYGSVTGSLHGLTAHARDIFKRLECITRSSRRRFKTSVSWWLSPSRLFTWLLVTPPSLPRRMGGADLYLIGISLCKGCLWQSLPGGNRCRSSITQTHSISEPRRQRAPRGRGEFRKLDSKCQGSGVKGDKSTQASGRRGLLVVRPFSMTLVPGAPQGPARFCWSPGESGKGH